MKRPLLVLAVLSTGLSAHNLTPATAAGMPTFWPKCTTTEQVECVESLSHTSTAGTITEYENPGEGGTGITVRVSITEISGSLPPGMDATALRTLNYELTDTANPVLGAGVFDGLPDGTYRFRLRLGSFDPTLTSIAGDPIAISWEKRSGGDFVLDITAKPKPFVTMIGFANIQQCMSSSWACAGEVGVKRAIAGAVNQHPTTSEREKVRGIWIATNASSFSSPRIDIANKKITTQAAGPHTVPDGFPLDGLTLEGGKGLNPGFYKAFVPYGVLQAMLDKAPAELRSFITPETVKAKIAEAGATKDQPVAVVSDNKGVTIDLQITHFSAPNPEITFSTPSTPATTTPSTPATTAPTSSSTSSSSKTLKVGKRLAGSALVKAPKGFKVVSVTVSKSSSKVCTARGTTVQAKKTGKCSFTVTMRKGKTAKRASGSITVVR